MATYLIALTFLVILSLRAFWLWWLFRKHRRSWSLPEPPKPARWPKLCVQLPMYNELAVAERIIRAAARLKYPGELEIQVLDDSDDETVGVVKRVVEELRAKGVNIIHVRRGSREGYKAGALAYGMALTDAELFAVFDADFVPPEDFLLKTVPYLLAEPMRGAVQARWGWLNDSQSPFTMLQAVMLDGHFIVEQFVRSREGLFLIFNGTAGVWKRRAIEDAGGWEHDTLTEDADLSYRAQMRGWEILYLPEVVCPSELVPDVNAFKAQQRRWTKGGTQTLRKILPRVFKGPYPLKVKLEAFFHLAGNLAYPAMVILALLTLPVMVIKEFSDAYRLYFAVAGTFIVAAGGFPLLYITALKHAYPDWRRRVLFVPFLISLTMGVSLNNAAAALEGLFKKGGVFFRTPKSGGKELLYKVAERKQQALAELALGVYMAITYLYSLAAAQLVMVPFTALYAVGFLAIGWESWASARALEMALQEAKE